MAALTVVVLAVLGVALVVLGIIAMRDEPPRWLLRIRRPGRMLVLGLVVIVGALILNAVRYSIEEEITDDTGQEVSCEKVGPLEIDGKERQVYSCIANESGGAHIGCYARDGDGAREVTLQAQRPGAFPEKPDC